MSKSVLLLESKFGLMGAFVTFWDARRPTCWPTPGRGPHRQSGRRTACWSRKRSWAACSARATPRREPRSTSTSSRSLRVVTARFLARACFFGLDPGCRAMFFVAAPWFSTSGNQKGGGRSCSLGRLSEHFRHRNALGFAWRRTSKSRRYVARAESSCEFLRARGQETTPAEQRFMKHP